MMKMNRKRLGMLALLGVLITAVVLVSGCTKSPTEPTPTDAQGLRKQSDPNPGGSLISILSQYQGKEVSLDVPQGIDAIGGTLKEVNENYIVIESNQGGYYVTQTIPISRISGILVYTSKEGTIARIQISFG